MKKRGQKLAISVTSDGISASAAAAVTVIHRMPLLFFGFIDPNPQRAEEARLMIAEKIEAAFEGSFAAYSSAYKQTHKFIKIAQKRGLDLDDVLEGLASIAAAASEPTLKRVHANAKRLSTHN